VACLPVPLLTGRQEGLYQLTCGVLNRAARLERSRRSGPFGAPTSLVASAISPQLASVYTNRLSLNRASVILSDLTFVIKCLLSEAQLLLYIQHSGDDVYIKIIVSPFPLTCLDLATNTTARLDSFPERSRRCTERNYRGSETVQTMA